MPENERTGMNDGENFSYILMPQKVVNNTAVIKANDCIDLIIRRKY